MAFPALGALALFTAPRWLVPLLAARATGCVYRMPTTKRMVALTIDDAPDATTTPGLLDELHRTGTHATFFIITSRLLGHEPLITRMLEDGHELGNHMTRDEPSVRLDSAAFERELASADASLRAFAAIHWFRPGSGWFNRRMLQEIHHRGEQCALGSLYPIDAQLPWPWLAQRFVLANVQPGSIIILHDGDGRGRRTARTLRAVLPELARRGYAVVTLTTLAEQVAGAPR